MKMKLINVKTKEKKTLILDKEVFYQPYLGKMEGSISGHSHQEAYFDKKGNEYRKDYGKIALGSSNPLKIDYYTSSSAWGHDSVVVFDKNGGN